MDVTALLNEYFECKRCGIAGSWVRIARPAARLNSIVHRLQCAHCGDQIVAKEGRYTESTNEGAKELRAEYDTLRMLEAAFPREGRYGTLTPLGYLERAGRGVMVTRLFAGTDLSRFARALNDVGVAATFQAAGTWLRKLHDCDDHARPMQSLGVADKVSSVGTDCAAILRKDSRLRDMRKLLAQVGSEFEGLVVPAVRLHGDFKPENMLCDGARYLGLDIHWQFIGAAVYDLAPFLNHLWLTDGVMGATRRASRHELAETAFLSGYGYAGDTRVLRWAQLYFALHYMGEHRRWGRLGAAYVNRKLIRLAHRRAWEVQHAIR
jgi:hypothetical protein